MTYTRNVSIVTLLTLGMSIVTLHTLGMSFFIFILMSQVFYNDKLNIYIVDWGVHGYMIITFIMLVPIYRLKLEKFKLR